jgi:hypothetical protein
MAYSFFLLYWENKPHSPKDNLHQGKDDSVAEQAETVTSAFSIQLFP